jgi:hypothetical protein
MKPQTALDKITELGQQMLNDPNPETVRLGAALLAIPVSAADSYESLQEIIHLIFTFVRVKTEQNEAIKELLR